MKDVVDIDVTTPHYPSLSTGLDGQSGGDRKGKGWGDQSGKERGCGGERGKIGGGGGY